MVEMALSIKVVFDFISASGEIGVGFASSVFVSFSSLSVGLVSSGLISTSR